MFIYFTDSTDVLILQVISDSTVCYIYDISYLKKQKNNTKF